MTDLSVRTDWAEFTQTSPTPGTVELPVVGMRVLTAVELAASVDHFLKHLGPGHWTDRAELVLRKLQANLGNRPMTSENFAEAWDKIRGYTRNQSKPLSDSSLEIHRKIYAEFERWLNNQGIVQHMFRSEIPRKKMVSKFRQPITHAEHQALLGASKLPLTTYMLKGMWMTGLALVDLQLLEWRHVDLEQMVIRKHRQKSDTPCVVPIIHGSPFHLALLELHRDRLKSVGVFPSVNGKHYVHQEAAMYRLSGARGVQRYLDAVTKSLGLRKICWHDYRATFCTYTMAVGEEVGVSQMTGHSDPKALRGYTEPSLNKLREVVESAVRYAEERK